MEQQEHNKQDQIPDLDREVFHGGRFDPRGAWIYRVKAGALSALVIVSLWIQAPRDAKALFGAGDVVFDPTAYALQETMSRFFQTTLMNFLQQQLMGFLQQQLTNTLGQGFGGMVNTALRTTTVQPQNVQTVYKATVQSVPGTQLQTQADKINQAIGAHPDTIARITGGNPNAMTQTDVMLQQAQIDTNRELVTRASAAAANAEQKCEGGYGCAPNSAGVKNAGSNAPAATAAASAESSNKGMAVLNPDNTMLIEDALFDNVLLAARVDPRSFDHRNQETIRKISVFLTPQPIIPANAEPAYEQDALDVERAGVLVDVMMGTNSLPIMAAETLKQPRAKSFQLKVWTRFSRLQLARQALTWSFLKSTHANMAKEYEEFVLKPNDDNISPARFGSAGPMINMIRLAQGTNMSLMRLREIQMDQTRMLAVMLTTMTESSGKDEEAAGMFGVGQ